MLCVLFRITWLFSIGFPLRFRIFCKCVCSCAFLCILKVLFFNINLDFHSLVLHIYLKLRFSVVLRNFVCVCVFGFCCCKSNHAYIHRLCKKCDFLFINLVRKRVENIILHTYFVLYHIVMISMWLLCLCFILCVIYV